MHSIPKMFRLVQKASGWIWYAFYLLVCVKRMSTSDLLQDKISKSLHQISINFDEHKHYRADINAQIMVVLQETDYKQLSI